jgi:hypothetical protein
LSAKYTPGPWDKAPYGIEERARRFHLVHAGARHVAFIDKTADDSEANARLIAAAPELAEALRWCYLSLGYMPLASIAPGAERSFEAGLKAAGAALKKAGVLP